MAQRIEQFDSPRDVFQAIVGNAVRLNGHGSNTEDILHELNTNQDLASVSFMFHYLSCFALAIFFSFYILMIVIKAPVYTLLSLHLNFLGSHSVHKLKAAYLRVQDYVEMLQRDIHRRLPDGYREEK